MIQFHKQFNQQRNPIPYLTFSDPKQKTKTHPLKKYPPLPQFQSQHKNQTLIEAQSLTVSTSTPRLSSTQKQENKNRNPNFNKRRNQKEEAESQSIGAIESVKKVYWERKVKSDTWKTARATNCSSLRVSWCHSLFWYRSARELYHSPSSGWELRRDSRYCRAAMAIEARKLWNKESNKWNSLLCFEVVVLLYFYFTFIYNNISSRTFSFLFFYFLFVLLRLKEMNNY